MSTLFRLIIPVASSYSVPNLNSEGPLLVILQSLLIPTVNKKDHGCPF